MRFIIAVIIDDRHGWFLQIRLSIILCFADFYAMYELHYPVLCMVGGLLSWRGAYTIISFLFIKHRRNFKPSTNEEPIQSMLRHAFRLPTINRGYAIQSKELRRSNAQGSYSVRLRSSLMNEKGLMHPI